MGKSWPYVTYKGFYIKNILLIKTGLQSIFMLILGLIVVKLKKICMHKYMKITVWHPVLDMPHGVQSYTQNIISYHE